jgi:hypothetical protein
VNKKMKVKSQPLMIVLVAILATALILANIQVAYAMAPHHFGKTTKNIVCGDKLCKDVKGNSISPVTPSHVKNIQD